MGRQVSLALPERPRRGRPRRKGPPGYVLHQTRPWHDRRHPVHVTWKFREGLPTLRRAANTVAIGKAIRKNVAGNLARQTGFRVLQFAVQPNHVHLIVEGTSKEVLTGGLRGLGVWIVRKLNQQLGRTGTGLRERYHARALTTPREVRNALVYVLQNHKHHARSRNIVDECSSAFWFDGWKQRVPRPTAPSPVATPQTWLAGTGWRLHGLIGLHEAPAG